MNTVTKQHLLALGLVASLIGCSGSELYVTFEHVELQGETRIPGSRGCTVATLAERSGVRSQSSGGRVDGDFQVDHVPREDRLDVTVSSAGQELAARSYDESFLLSGELDRFAVTTSAGRRYELSYRGNRECVQPPPE